MKKTILAAVVLSTLALSGCQFGNPPRPNYGPSYVGQAQEVQQIEIVSVTPEAINVQNPNRNGSASKAIGTVVGAVAGAAIGGAIDRHRDPWGHKHPGALGVTGGALVGGAAGYAAGSYAGNRMSNNQTEGASITFRTREGYTYTTLQAARACEFRPGPANMLNSGQSTVTIQPNNPGGC